jgi:hypothetical protein
MGFFTDKILLTLFMLRLKTKRVVKSAIHGKLNYQARTYAPYVLGAMIAAWLLFIFSV